MGVWIEIYSSLNPDSSVCMSLPSWECGLKSDVLQNAYLASHVTPFVGVWIEIAWRIQTASYKLSLPSWECGLKFQGLRCLCSPDSVTPFVGVWIEIGQPQLQIHFHSSLPSWECGLKYLIFLM